MDEGLMGATRVPKRKQKGKGKTIPDRKTGIEEHEAGKIFDVRGVGKNSG